MLYVTKENSIQALSRLLKSFNIFVLLLSVSPIAQEVDTTAIKKLSLGDLLDMEISFVSKRSEKISDAPGVISVITAQEIETMGANSLIDILERASSIQPISSYFFINNVMSIRGDLMSHTDNHILVLLNGRPIREGTQGGQNYNIYTTFPVNAIKRIEIIRGPGSVLYGTNAFAGVINIVAKKADDMPTASISCFGGSFKGIGGEFHSGRKIGDFSYTLSGRYFQEDGWELTATTGKPGPPNVAPDIAGSKEMAEKNFNIISQLAFKDLQVSTYFSHVNYEALGKLPYWPYAGDVTSNLFVADLGYVWKINDYIEIVPNITATYYDQLHDFTSESPHISFDLLYELHLKGEIIEDFNYLIGGLVYNKRRDKDLESDGSSVTGTYSLFDASTYLQVDYSPVKQIKVLAGSQINKPEGGDFDFVPRLGLVYNPVKYFGIKALYGQAFRSPWPIEQYVDQPPILTAPTKVNEPALTPEKISTIDLQLFITPTDRQYYAVTYFNSRYTDIISRKMIDPANVSSQYPASTQTYLNGDEVLVNGVEAEYKVTFMKNFCSIGSVLYQKNHEKDETDFFMYSPNFMGKIGVSYTTPFGLSLGVFNTVFGEPPEIPDNIQKSKTKNVNPEPKLISLLSTNVGYRLPINFDVTFNFYVQNLLNQEYHFPEFIKKWINTLPMGPGMALYGKLTIDF